MQSKGTFDPDELKRAARILDLSLAAGFTEDDVRRQWRKLIERVHPDAGGSNYFAEEANLAREMLLAWIAGGRKFSTASPPPGDQTKNQRGPTSPEPPTSSYAAKAAKGAYKLVKGGLQLIFGLFIWAIILRVGFSLISDKGVKPSQARAMTWQRIPDEQNNDGAIIHSLQRVVFGAGADAVTLYIACAPRGIAAAPLVKLLVGAGGSITLEKVNFRRADDSDPLEAIVAANNRAAGMTFIKSIESMSNDEQASEFGAVGLALLGKWLLAGSSSTEVSNDIVRVMRSHYDPIFANKDLLMEVVYKDPKGEHQDIETIDFGAVQHLRDELFKSCHIRDPYEASQ